MNLHTGKNTSFPLLVLGGVSVPTYPSRHRRRKRTNDGRFQSNIPAFIHIAIRKPLGFYQSDDARPLDFCFIRRLHDYPNQIVNIYELKCVAAMNYFMRTHRLSAKMRSAYTILKYWMPFGALHSIHPMQTSSTCHRGIVFYRGPARLYNLWMTTESDTQIPLAGATEGFYCWLVLVRKWIVPRDIPAVRLLPPSAPPAFPLDEKPISLPTARLPPPLPSLDLDPKLPAQPTRPHDKLPTATAVPLQWPEGLGRDAIRTAHTIVQPDIPKLEKVNEEEDEEADWTVVDTKEDEVSEPPAKRPRSESPIDVTLDANGNFVQVEAPPPIPRPTSATVSRRETKEREIKEMPPPPNRAPPSQFPSDGPAPQPTKPATTGGGGGRSTLKAGQVYGRPYPLKQASARVHGHNLHLMLESIHRHSKERGMVSAEIMTLSAIQTRTTRIHYGIGSESKAWVRSNWVNMPLTLRCVSHELQYKRWVSEMVAGYPSELVFPQPLPKVDTRATTDADLKRDYEEFIRANPDAGLKDNWLDPIPNGMSTLSVSHLYILMFILAPEPQEIPRVYELVREYLILQPDLAKMDPVRWITWIKALRFPTTKAAPQVYEDKHMPEWMERGPTTPGVILHPTLSFSTTSASDTGAPHTHFFSPLDYQKQVEQDLADEQLLQSDSAPPIDQQWYWALEPHVTQDPAGPNADLFVRPDLGWVGAALFVGKALFIHDKTLNKQATVRHYCYPKTDDWGMVRDMLPHCDIVLAV